MPRTTDDADLRPATIRRRRWFAVHDLPFVAAGLVTTLPRHHPTVAATVLLVLAALAIGGLQARHTLAAVRGERPAGAVWTFLALAALVYVPMWWYTWDWAVMQWFVIASAAMVLPGRIAPVAAAAPIVGQTAVITWLVFTASGADTGDRIVVPIYHITLLAMGSAVLYGSAWLGRVLTDLDAARTEMAELAVGRERLRVSRDLHDVLGQSLSAVSLKGDLALRLLPTDVAAARAEVEGLTGLARDALRDVRAVVRDEHVVSLAAEIDAATRLLDAAGIDAHIGVDVGLDSADRDDGDYGRSPLPWPVEEVLAWAVREGTTNLLRHSDATTCSITATRRAGTIHLQILNDGLRTPPPGSGGSGGSGDTGGTGGTGHAGDTVPTGGTGIASLAARAQALSGSVTAGPTVDGRFRLVVELPEVPDVPEAAGAAGGVGVGSKSGSGV